MALEHEVHRRVEQRVAGSQQLGGRQAGLCDELLLEGDALVAAHQRPDRPDRRLPVADGHRNVRGLEAPRLAPG